jgi:hypothetical protein
VYLDYGAFDLGLQVEFRGTSTSSLPPHALVPQELVGPERS